MKLFDEIRAASLARKEMDEPPSPLFVGSTVRHVKHRSVGVVRNFTEEGFSFFRSWFAMLCYSGSFFSLCNQYGYDEFCAVDFFILVFDFD
jgi:hypothetical protein